jgi:hypothetical protein
MALVNNCDPWTFLGNRPVSPTPDASFDTGLDVYARTRMGVPGVLWSASRMTRRRSTEPAARAAAEPAARDAARSGADTGRLRRLLGRNGSDGAGGPASAPLSASRQALGALVVHDLTDFALSAAKPLPFQVDGDALDKREYVRFREIPEALEVFV